VAVEAGEIDSLARRWVIRKDKGSLTAEDEAELQSWLDADPRHLGAYVRAQAAWEWLGRARILDREPKAAPRWFARHRIAVAAAVCAAASVGAGAALQPTTYETAGGHIRRVGLPDGSMAVLDAGARVKTWIHLGRRDITVERGEAWFLVAHDPTRPFVVRAGATAVRAVGTAFSVARTATGVDVIVTQGVVAAAADPAQPAVRVRAGTEAVLDGGAVRVAALSPLDIDGQLAWREGRIALNGAPLREAIARFNRYNDRKLVLASPELGDISTVGWFQANDPESFARALAVGLHARVDLSADAITISRVAEKN
jgi:transmembrane sensor